MPKQAQCRFNKIMACNERTERQTDRQTDGHRAITNNYAIGCIDLFPYNLTSFAVSLFSVVNDIVYVQKRLINWLEFRVKDCGLVRVSRVIELGSGTGLGLSLVLCLVVG